MKNVFLFTIAMLCGLHSIGQDTNPIVTYREYATQQYMRDLITAHPEILQAQSAIDAQVQQYQEVGSTDAVSLPMVFHLVGQAPSAITMEDVMAQLSCLNRDFNSPRFDEIAEMPQAWEAEQFKEAAGVPTIQFCLAKQSPSGESSSGVIYEPTLASEFPVGIDIMTIEGGGAPSWNTQSYINVWVAPLKNGIAGFAQMPGGPGSSDGIVINSAYFARKDNQTFIAQHPEFSNYTLGRTLSHLMGSYLNLHELWDEEHPCGDDGVADTPIHNAPNIGKPIYRHVSTCSEYPVEMTMNLMDNTDDEVQFMFTKGQVMRMYAAISTDGGARSGLRSTTITQCSGHDLTDSGTGDRGTVALILPATELELKAFPNPASNAFTIVVPSPCESDLKVTIYNGYGVQIYEEEVHNIVEGLENRLHVNSRDWSSGVYLIKVKCGDKMGSTKLILDK